MTSTVISSIQNNHPCTYLQLICTSKSKTTTTKTIPTTKKTECIPETITITEKNIETITEKEIVTITVKGESTDTPQPLDQQCAPKWEQCGGKNFNGPTCCQSGSTCHVLNEYYSQCF